MPFPLGYCYYRSQTTGDSVQEECGDPATQASRDPMYMSLQHKDPAQARTPIFYS